MKTEIILSIVVASLPALASAARISDTGSSGLRLKSGLPINLKSAAPMPANQFDFSKIRYDAKLGMLVFPDQDSFNKTMNALDNYTQRYQFDNGKTSEFLSTIRQSEKVNDEFVGTLEKNSPLSDTVLTALLSGNRPPQLLKRILEANIDFDETIEGLYNKIKLPADLRAAIDKKRHDHMPEEVILDAFERLFPRYHSLRDKVNADEYKYLTNGGDPVKSDNPANGNILDRTMSTVLNDRKEVKIGPSICLILPHRNIKIANGDVKTLNYIRVNGTIPLNKPLPDEPANGFPISQAPPFVDPNIVVQPTDRQNGCGGTVSTGGHEETGRVAYHTTIKGSAYYWKFGDGFVSYKQDPSHQFADKLPNHTVTVTVYDDEGAGCGPSGAGHPAGTNGNNGNQCTAYVSLNTSTSGLNISATATINGFGGGEYYRWDFGDGSYQNGGGLLTVTHSYPSPGQYTVSVSVNDLNLCTASAVEIVNVAGSSNTGGTPKNCCDAREHEHEGGLAPDDTHKFNHKLAIEHFLTYTCRLHAEVVSYKAWYPFGVKCWYHSGTTSNVDINGTVYSPSSTDDCGVGTIISLPQQNHNGIWNTLNYPFPTQVRVQRDSVQSNGGAFSGNTTVTISDCD